MLQGRGSALAQSMKIINAFRVFMYIGVGCFLLAFPELLSQYPSYIRIGAGVLIILYGLFRFYLFVREIIERKKEQIEQPDEDL